MGVSRAFDREWKRDRDLVRAAQEIAEARSLVGSALVKLQADKRTTEVAAAAENAVSDLARLTSAINDAVAGSPRLFDEEASA